MIASIALALLAQHFRPTEQQVVYPFDTGWQDATYNIWPQNFPDFEFWIPPASQETQQVTICGEMWIDANLAIYNDTDEPMTCLGSLSMRYNICHDDLEDPTDQEYGFWRFWLGAQGAGFEIGDSLPLQPHEMRFLPVHVGGEGNIVCFDSTDTLYLWQQSGVKIGNCDVYYPTVGRVNDVDMPGGIQNPDNWESLGCFVWVMTPEEYGAHVPHPTGRLTGWVTYR